MNNFHRKAAVATVAIGAAIFVGMFLRAVYTEGHHERTVIDELAEALKNERRIAEEVAALDLEGGADPRRTLELFIAALEQNNAEQASRYIVHGTRAIERERIATILSSAKRTELIGALRAAAHATGTYSFAQDAYTIRAPMFIDFIRYPNGTWKIVEL